MKISKLEMLLILNLVEHKKLYMKILIMRRLVLVVILLRDLINNQASPESFLSKIEQEIIQLQEI